ncbi:MAG: flagellar motor switch protein FliM [Candidatus Rokubacteria bacterium]|nr:flagellar motor switch protein FliM [Candidatus Rokubacteria bacterium]
MTGETLSQQEIDALLNAVHAGKVPVTPSAAAPAVPAQAVRYNFRRPSRVSKEQVRGLETLHEEFAKHAAASLSGLLRTIVDIELEAVEQIAYSEYVMAIPTPTCSFVFNMEPLKGGAVLELNPSAAFVMIDRLLGGQGTAVPAARDLTEIERAVIERIGLRTMVDLQQAWHSVGAFVFRVLNLETNPQFLQVTAPNEVILVATFRLKIGGMTAGLTLAYPYLLLESVIGRLGAQRWQPTATTTATPEARAFMLSEISHSSIGLRAFLGHARLTVRDLLNLRPGQLIRIDAKAERPVRVEINKVAKFVGRPGTHRTRLAVEVLDHADERSSQ